MSTITLPNIRVSSDLTIRLKLKDGGVAIDWSTLQNIRVSLYADDQRSMASRCSVSIDEEDSTILVCQYAANKMQYLGVNRVIVQCKYMGEVKTYDKPAFNFVRWTSDQEGEQITIDDPDVDVEISVEDVSSSILQEAVDAAFSAADRANEAAEEAEHMVDIHTGPAGKSPYIGENGHWYEWDEETHQYVDTETNAKGNTGETPDISIGTVTTVEPGTPASASMSGTPEAPALNLSIPKGEVGSTPNISIGTVTTGAPGTPVVITITGTAEAPVLNITIPQGMKGDTGVSADYPITIYNGLDSDATDAALSAAQGKVLDGKISQLRQKVGEVVIPTTETGKYIDTHGVIGSILPAPTDNSSYRYMRYPVIPGDMVIANGTGGNYPRLWCFVDSDNKIISHADNGVTYAFLTAPENAVAVIINDKSNSLSYFISKTSSEGEIIVLKEGFSEMSAIIPDIEYKVNAGMDAVVPDETTTGKYINYNSGVLDEDSYYSCYKFNVQEKDTFLLTTTGGGNAVAVISFFVGDVYQQSISRQQYGGAFIIVIPKGVTKMYVSHNNSGSHKIRKSTLLLSSYIAEGAVVTEMVADKAITPSKLSDVSPYENTLFTKRTYNLYDEATMFVKGKYIDNSGDIENNSSWAISDYIPVEAGETYFLYAKSWGRTSGYVWYTSGKEKIDGDYGTIAGFKTAPSNAAYFRCNLMANNNKTEDFMIAKSTNLLPYMPYRTISAAQVEGLDDAVVNVLAAIEGKPLHLVNNEGYYNVYDGSDYIRLGQPSTSRNKNLNFAHIYKNGTQYDASDDITPGHFLNTTLGGNHAQPVQEATIDAHGFSDPDIGTAWVHSNGKTYYLVKIVDANKARFLSENEGTSAYPVFQVMQTGTLTRNGVTKTVTAVGSSQMWSGIKNESYRIIVDGKVVSNDAEEVYGNIIDFVESYDIMNPVSVLANLIANVGYNENGVYDGDAAVHIDITYRFLPGLNRIVTTDYVVLQEEMRFADYMFSQKTGSSTAKYYTPNCSAFRVPAVFSSEESVTITDNNTIKETGVPCNRVLQYYESQGFGFATGVLPGVGVGKNLGNYTDEYFQLRGSTKKIYPKPVTANKVGNTLYAGDMYTALMYYAIADLGEGNRMSVYHFNLNGVEYVFADYKGSMIDRIELDDALNGKKVEVIESSNTEIISMDGQSVPFEENNIYNGGFYVKATYVEGETCYLVAKIK